MAKVKGTIVLKGTIGGINYYQTKHGQIAREAGGGFNGEAIRTKASMHRVRENASEFGHCSKANKLFRQAVSAFHEHYTFEGLHGHLMRLFTGLKDLDGVHPRGQRRVGIGAATDAGKSLLRQFRYTPASQMGSYFPYLPDYHPDTFQIRYDAIAMRSVKFPKGATHLKLMGGVLDLDFNSMAYQRYAAPPVFIDRNFEGGVLAITLDPLPPIAHLELPVLGMRYYQRVGGEFLPLNDERFVNLIIPSTPS